MAVSAPQATGAVDPDDFDRVAKLLVDAGDAETFPEAAAILRRHRLRIVADAEACRTPAWQAAIVTAVNCGARAVHGGVEVELAEDAPFALPLGTGSTLAEMVTRYGGTIVTGGPVADVSTAADVSVPTIVFGSSGAAVGSGKGALIYARASQWTAAVGPAPVDCATEASVVAAVAAAALAVSEAFQRLRGNVVAAERAAAVNFWEIEGGAEGPAVRELPSDAWLLGLGHLGQAYAWLFALLPYPDGGRRRLVLQDDDRLSPANRATSMLHTEETLGLRKTRLAAAALEDAGFDTTIVERRFDGSRLHMGGDPPLLLAGVDNPDARRLLDDAGFHTVVDAGLGAGPDGYLGMTIRRLPASRPSREIWPTGARRRARAPRWHGAYDALAAETGDRCGVEQLAGRTVATSFVGVMAAAFVIGGVMRELHGGAAYELVDYTLRTPGRVTAIPAGDAKPLRLATLKVR